MNPGTRMLLQMASARRFNRWMADAVSTFLGPGAVLEIGAGIGNLTELLCPGRSRYVATDTDEDHLLELHKRLASIPHLQVALFDAADPAHSRRFQNQFETVVCFNVLEHIPDDEGALANIYRALQSHGKAVVLVPQGTQAFGSLDEVLEHQRRYNRAELACKMERAGFRIESISPFNRATYPGWILNSRLLRRRTLSSFQLKLFDLSVPLWRRVDHFLPWPPTSLIAVGVKEP